MGNSSTTTPIPGRLTLTQLCRSRDFQIRAKLCRNTTRNYSTIIKAGGDMPPLQVALVDGVHILVDGFHRAAAYEALGYEDVDVEVTPATRDEALWMAAQANTRHGLPLTNREQREVFRVYVRTKQYLKGKRRKSYREMQNDLKKGHATLRNWMQQDFPGLFRAMGGDDLNHSPGGLPDGQPKPPEGARSTLKALQGIHHTYQQTEDPETRKSIQDMLQEFALAIVGEGWKEVSSDF